MVKGPLSILTNVPSQVGCQHEMDFASFEKRFLLQDFSIFFFLNILKPFFHKSNIQIPFEKLFEKSLTQSFTNVC